MNAYQAVLATLDALEELEISYILVGSFSTNYYGLPRSTEDADFVVHLENKSPRQIAARLGPAFRLDPQMSFETVTLTTRHVVEVLGSPFTIELFQLSEDEHDQARFARRRTVEYLERRVSLPTVEDVIITKLRWAMDGGRAKDRKDAQEVIAVQQNAIDWDYVQLWTARHGTQPLLDEIRNSIPPL